MYRIPLKTLPNQRATVRLDGCVYDITIKALGQGAVVALQRDGALVVSGVRAVADGWVIPYPHLEGPGGNFVWHTETGAYPHYTRFESTDGLYYFTAAELAANRGGV